MPWSTASGPSVGSPLAWAAFAVLVLASVAIGVLARPLVRGALRWLGRRRSSAFAGALVERTRRPLELLLVALVARAGVRLLPVDARARALFEEVLYVAIVLAVAWCLLRAVDVGVAASVETAYVRDRPHLHAALPFMRRLGKVVLGLLLFLAVLKALGFDPSVLVTSLGLAGAGAALAARRALENLVAGLILVTDQPFLRGHAIRAINPRGVRFEGAVERVGLQSTRLRMADGAILTLPNHELTSMAIENLSTREAAPGRIPA